jgi:hypothetical protein
MHMIADCEPSYLPAAIYRRLSVRPHRILYTGLDIALLDYLEESLDDCWIVRAPAGHVARLFIDKLNYSLLLFNEQLMDTTGAELTRFVRSLAHRKHTPVIISKQSDNFELLARTITRLLAQAKRYNLLAQNLRSLPKSSLCPDLF